MKKINKIVLQFLLMAISYNGFSQEIAVPEPNIQDTLLNNLKQKALDVVSSEPQMADTFRSDGKIYVVITVISIIFICLIGYLIYIDTKLRKLENK